MEFDQQINTVTAYLSELEKGHALDRDDVIQHLRMAATVATTVLGHIRQMLVQSQQAIAINDNLLAVNVELVASSKKLTGEVESLRLANTMMADRLLKSERGMVASGNA